MLAEKAKQQEEMLVEYDENEVHNKDLESEVELLRAQVSSMKDELKVGYWRSLLVIFISNLADQNTLKFFQITCI